MRKLIFTLFILLGILQDGITQSPYLDSLYQDYLTIEDEVRFKSLYRYCYGLSQIDSKKSIELLLKGEEELNASNSSKEYAAYVKGLFCEVKALVADNNGNNEECLNHYQRCLELSKDAGEKYQYILEGIAYWGRGLKYGQQGLFKSSNENILLAKNAFEKGGETSRVGSAYGQISQNFHQLEKYDSTLVYIDKAFEYVPDPNDWIHFFYSFLKANALNELKMPDSTIEMLPNDYLKNAERIQPVFYSHLKMALSDAYVQKEQFEIAQRYLAAAKEVVDSTDERQLYHNYLLSKLNYDKGTRNLEVALQSMETLKAFEDSLNQQITNQEFMNLQTKYETQSKDFTIQSLEAKGKYQRNLMMIGGTLFSLALLAMYFWFKNREAKRKVIHEKNNQQISLTFKFDEPEIKDDFLKKISHHIYDNLSNEKFSVEDLAQLVGVHRNKMNKKLKEMTDKTAKRLIRDIRLEKAKSMLHHNGKNVSQIAFEVGFKDPNYFSSCFRDYFGMPPSEIKKKA